jgi:5'(3')-deoxyribonucleotidase
MQSPQKSVWNTGDYTPPEPHEVELLLDVDGVFANFIDRAFDVVEKFYGKRYAVHEMKAWDLFEMFPREPKKEKKCYEEFKKKGFCMSLDVYPGSHDAVKKLHEKTPHVYFATSPINGPHWAYERAQWLKKQFNVPTSRVINTSAKWQLIGDVLLDDRPDNLYQWLLRHPYGQGILWGQPYNESAPAHPRVKRVTTWDEVYQIVDDVKAKKEKKTT